MLIEMHSFRNRDDRRKTSVLFILTKFISQNVTLRPSFLKKPNGFSCNLFKNVLWLLEKLGLLKFEVIQSGS